jgi:hypothetical protein
MVISARVTSKFAVNMLRNMDRDANAKLMLAVGKMAEAAYARCKEMVSLDDHTLAELAKAGHPYAKADPQTDFHTPYEQIHARADAILDGLEATRPVAHWGEVTAEVHNNEQPLDTWLQKGTRTMVARPYMQFVVNKYASAISAVGMAIMDAWVASVKRSRRG